MEQRTRDLNNPTTTEEHDSFPFPIEPLRSISSTNKPKRSSMHSSDSGITSPFASSRSLCYHLQFLRKYKPPIFLLISKHKLFNCRPGNILAQCNILFVTVPTTWLEAALNRALRSPNTIAHSTTAPILSQYCKQPPGKAINFDPLHRIATFLYLFYYMHHYFLLEIITLFNSQFH